MNKQKVIKFLCIACICWIFFCFCNVAKGETINSINSGSTLTSGDIDAYNYSVGAKTVTKGAFKSFTLGVDYLYGELVKKKNNENLYLYEEFEDRLVEDIYYVFDSSLEYDYASDLERRILLTPAIGVYLDKTLISSFTVDIGASYKIEKYDNELLKDTILPRIRQRYNQIFIDGKVSVSEKACYYVKINNSNDYMLDLEVEGKIKLIDQLGLFTKIKNNYDNTPNEGHKHNNLITTTGVIYEF